MPQGLYFAGFSAADANPDMGDRNRRNDRYRRICHGGVSRRGWLVGAGSASSAAVYTRTMSEITVGENPEWSIPALDFAGVPTGIDIRLVIDTGLAPVINTGIAHKKAGVGQVGAGIVRAPIACFTQAARALAERLGV